MSLITKPFSIVPNAATKTVVFSSPYDTMDIKGIQLSIVKPGAYKIVGNGYSNGSSHACNYLFDNGTNVSANYSDTKCVQVKEYSGGTWVTKVEGTADLSTAGEITFSFTYYDSTYKITGIAIAETA